MAGTTTAHGSISAGPCTLHYWTRATVSDVKRLRKLEGENAKLRRMYADLALAARPRCLPSEDYDIRIYDRNRECPEFEVKIAENLKAH